MSNCSHHQSLMPRSHHTQPVSPTADLTWSDSAELVGLVFEVVPRKSAKLLPQYTTSLHAWFLDQVRSLDPELSAELHDGESKSFTVSGFEGEMDTTGGQLQLVPVNPIAGRLLPFRERWCSGWGVGCKTYPQQWHCAMHL